jgi:uncharacterized membrane protein YfcA
MLVVLFLAGIVAGFLNAVAGGGSAITIPILTDMVGVSVANGTNRIAILVANVTAVIGYNKEKKVPWDRVRPLIPATLVGAMGGAWVATQLSGAAMQRVFAVVLGLVALSVLIRPRQWLNERTPRLSRPWADVAFLLIGFYGGFVQVGVGFLLLAGLVLGAGLDLVKGNGAKVALVASYTWIALLLFLWAGQVDLLLGVVLAGGNATGAYVSTRMAVRRGAPWVRWVLIVAAASAALRMATI